jgi:4-oxalocrotonate tautomerase
MPIVEITLIEGRPDEAKIRLHEKVAEAIHEAIDAPKESIRIIIREVPPVHFSVAGAVKGKPKPKT